jgi:hypothetical protein
MSFIMTFSYMHTMHFNHTHPHYPVLSPSFILLVMKPLTQEPLGTFKIQTIKMLTALNFSKLS